ncbi:helix-turn-helix transcriptional regulator [Paenibacillus sediminis]|uniref:Transcriptional regulator with XRE-family HTH domain n=1 Tax=Paenibacillus sediminis TaxID=664909 RepID=A0ABS4H7I3_9BACL|nr:helix-turn-helix transcriptional regulator [Paenibacillus sediminis]MBP1938508.1 transcriptional regulator with XRE-family HTH domain [Paenibacillus sediminis]
MNDDNQKQAHLDEEESEKGKVIEISDSFGQLLKHFRKIRNYSLKELEEISGVSSSYIFRIESGQRKSVSIIKIFQLCEALEVSYHEVLKTAFDEVETERKSENSLQELMISNDFMIDGQPVSRNAKEILVKINEQVISSTWTEQTKVRELCILSELIDQLKIAKL